MSDTPDELKGEPIPLQPEAASKPLLDLEDDSCPNCRSPMAKDAVVCFRCGFDQKSNTIRRPEVTVDEVEPPKRAPEFVEPGRLSAKTLAIVGVCLTVLAMVAAGYTNRALGWSVVTAAVAVTLYNTLLHACTGAAAVGIASRFAEEKFSRVELATARMLVAFALFQIFVSLSIPGVPIIVSKSALAIVGVGAYFLAVMVLFRKDHTKAGMIALMHLGLWTAVHVAAWLSVWLDAAVASAPHTASH